VAPSFSGKLSGLFNELLLALGTADGDLAFAPGDPDSLLATGATEVPVVPVLDPLLERQEFPILLVTLVGVPGKGSENGNAHKDIGEDKQHQAQNGDPDQHGKYAGTYADPENGTVEVVRAVPACHKMPER
jgi:hypothetical protein